MLRMSGQSAPQPDLRHVVNKPVLKCKGSDKVNKLKIS